MRVWHDDVRRPPSTGWVWVRNNADARDKLLTGCVSEISLDHDMGGEHINPDTPDAHLYKGDSEDTGMKLVDWMIRREIFPAVITIHSWNVPRAHTMVKAFVHAGARATYLPYEHNVRT